MKIMAILYEKTITEVIADRKFHLRTDVQYITYDTYDMIRLDSEKFSFASRNCHLFRKNLKNDNYDELPDFNEFTLCDFTEFTLYDFLIFFSHNRKFRFGMTIFRKLAKLMYL